MALPRLDSIVAHLLKEYHLSVEEVADLTDYQIQALYFHPRTRDGDIDFASGQAPDGPAASPEAVDSFMASMAKSLGIPDEKVKALKERRRERDLGRPPDATP